MTAAAVEESRAGFDGWGCSERGQAEGASVMDLG